MARLTLLCSMAAMALLAGTCLAQDSRPATATSTQPATPSAAAVQLAKIRSLLERPRAQTREEFDKLLKQRLTEAIRAVEDMEKKYPKAKEIHEARMAGVVAAGSLARATGDAKMAAKADAFAKAIIASKGAPADYKVTADAHQVLLKIKPVVATASVPADRGAKLILEYTKRHAAGPKAAEALILGLTLARVTANAKLMETLKATLIERFPEHPMALRLKAPEPGARVGRPFVATLTKLDGAKLTLPGDLKGKVVVLDFWATWCGPCIREIPRMKQVYAKYKDQGVEFLGISLDRAGSRERIAAFVKQRQMDWIHAYSGKFWDDPTARKYGIRGIPALWVVGRDGLVVSENARGRLAEIIEKALKPPASAATTQPASTPTTRPKG